MGWSVSRAEAVQAAGDEIEPGDNVERGGVLRVPGRRERGGEAPRAGGDRPLREQALPGAVPGRGLPVPCALLLLPGHGPGHQALRDGAQARQR